MMHDGVTYIVWPVGENLNVDNSTKVRNLEPCRCHFRKQWDCPCEHELAVRVIFDVTKYSKRWLCQGKFEECYPQLQPTLLIADTSNVEYSITDQRMQEKDNNYSEKNQVID